MFKFLKDKLKKSISIFSKKIEEEGEEEIIEEEKTIEIKPDSKEKEPAEEEKTEEDMAEEKEEPKKEGFFKRLFKKKEKEETAEEDKTEEKTPEKETAEEEDKTEEKTPEKKEEPKKKSFFKKITERVVTRKINSEKFEEMFWDLEVIMLENNIAVGVIEKIKEDLQEKIIDKPIPRKKIEDTIISSLRNSIEEVLSIEQIDLLKNINKKKPYIICFVGINGSGKTTTIAKVAQLLLNNNKKVVLAAADTFRAAAIDQLQIHADNLGIKMIKHDYGSDPAAVAFDAIKYAESKDIDVVLIDTAGRLHSNINLVDEMKKIIRIANPDMNLFIGESITGNDCVEQAEKFNEAININGIILSKADVDEKGGAAISISYVTQKPILYLGTGQGYGDIKPFDKKEVIQSLGL